MIETMKWEKLKLKNIHGYLLRHSYKYYSYCVEHKHIHGDGFVKEYARDYNLGWQYYESVPVEMKKTKKQVEKELSMLHSYWHCFPDSYFVYNMFLRDKTDFEWMKSFQPQAVFDKFSKIGDAQQYNIILDDKTIFRTLMNYYGIPIAPCLFVYRDGSFYKENCLSNPISDTKIDVILRDNDTARIFAKCFSGGQGSGIHLFERKDNTYYHDGHVVSATYIRQWCGSTKYFFEKQVVNENSLNHINPSSLNTIRMTVKQVEGKVSLVSAVLRLSVGGCYMDNMHQGGLAVEVDMEKGTLQKYAYRKWDYHRYEIHPDTKIPFEGVVIKNWEKVKSLVLNTTCCLPPFRSLGFDVAITNEGPLIIEINTYPGNDLPQIVRSYGLAREFEIK